MKRLLHDEGRGVARRGLVVCCVGGRSVGGVYEATVCVYISCHAFFLVVTFLQHVLTLISSFFSLLFLVSPFHQARNDLAHSKEKRHKDSGQLQEYTEQRTAKQKEMTSLRTAGDETGANRLQSDLNVLARLEKGQRDNVANDEVEVKTMMDKLKVAEEESANNARQNTLQSTKLLSELQKAKDAAQGSVSKAMQDESKQAQIITQNSPPL
jgi:hypothetical protein